MGWLPLPYNFNLLQSHIINPSNQYSLTNMLPIPDFITEKIGSHAFCTLKQLVAYIVFFDHIKNYSQIKNTHQNLVNSTHVQQYLTQIQFSLSKYPINVLC